MLFDSSLRRLNLFKALFVCLVALPLFLGPAIPAVGEEVSSPDVSWSQGWVKDGSYWRYGLSDGSFACDCWVKDGGLWYRIGEDGGMCTGWFQLDGTWYFADPNGVLASGWRQIDGSWYWFDLSSNAMSIGWVSVSGSWYLFGDSGAMRVGWALEGDSWYHLNDSGAMDTGWLFLGSWYYLDLTSGAMASGVKLINGDSYYFDRSGAMGTEWCEDDNADWYYANGSGVLLAGWLKLNGVWYWLDQETYVMATGVTAINGKEYIFDISGAMRTGWTLYDGSWFYSDFSGELQSGWLFLGGSWYWLDPSTHRMTLGVTQVNGTNYYFDTSGAMIIGWAEDNGSWYYANADGTLQTGWLNLNGTWYWFDLLTAKMQVGWVKIDNKGYFFHDSGAMALNEFVYDGDDLYWLGPSGCSLAGKVDTKAGAFYFEKDPDELGRFAAINGIFQNDDGKLYYTDGGGIVRGQWVEYGASRRLWTNSSTGEICADYELASDDALYYSNGDSVSSNSWVDLGDDWFFVGADGKLTRDGFVEVDGLLYCLDSAGLMTTGWQLIDGNWLYFKIASGGPLGSAVVDDWQWIGNYWYHFDENGYMQTGWLELDGNSYYLATSDFVGYPEGACLVGCRRVVDGMLCTFGDNGELLKKEEVTDDPFENRLRDSSLSDVSWFDDSVYLNAVISKANELSSSTNWFIAWDNELCRVVVLKWDTESRCWAVDKCWNCNGAYGPMSNIQGAHRIVHKKICNWADEFFGQGCNDWSSCFVEAYASSDSSGTLRWVEGKGYEDCAALHATGETTTGWVNRGCCGLLWENAKYVYDSIDVGSTVYVFKYGDGRVI